VHLEYLCFHACGIDWHLSSENANSSDSACDDDSDGDNGNSSDGKGFLMILTVSDA
jgi:hypothetical protein